MFGIGGQELVLLMIIGLIVLGPERLPRIANQVGSWLGQARRMTRVMKRQLEEELDINKPPTIQPPPSREPSFQPKPQSSPAKTGENASEEEYVLPRDDDDYSPAHGEDDPGTGVGDEPPDVLTDDEKQSASEAERAAVEEAAADQTAEKKEAS
jgi:sec-independent protein translocase protein TatB